MLLAETCQFEKNKRYFGFDQSRMHASVHYGWFPTRMSIFGRHFADDIFRYIPLKESYYHTIQSSLKYVRDGQIDNRSEFVLAIIGFQPRDRKLSDAMTIRFTDACMRHLA